MDNQPRIWTDEELQGTFLDFNLEEWAAEGKELSRKKGRDRWEIGDWLIRGEVRGRMEREQLKKQARKATGLSWESLKNCKSLSGSIEKSRRRDDLDYEHHALVAPFDPADQDMLLERAAKGDPRNKIHRAWSTDDLKKAIKRLRDDGTLPKSKKKPKLENTTGADADQNVVVRGKVSAKIHNFLRQLADVLGLKTPEAVIWHLAMLYYKENKDKLQVKINAASAKRGADFLEAERRDAPMEEQADDLLDKHHEQQENLEE